MKESEKSLGRARVDSCWSSRMTTCHASWDHLVLEHHLAPSFIGCDSVIQGDGDLVTDEQAWEVLLEILTWHPVGNRHTAQVTSGYVPGLGFLSLHCVSPVSRSVQLLTYQRPLQRPRFVSGTSSAMSFCPETLLPRQRHWESFALLLTLVSDS